MEPGFGQPVSDLGGLPGKRRGDGGPVRGRTSRGASTYAYYEGGIEIEIDTAPEHRQRGLATACAARLILTCLDRGLYPSWDAANPTSAALAEKLGYRPAGAYVTYAVTPV